MIYVILYLRLELESTPEIKCDIYEFRFLTKLNDRITTSQTKRLAEKAVKHNTYYS